MTNEIERLMVIQLECYFESNEGTERIFWGKKFVDTTPINGTGEC